MGRPSILKEDQKKYIADLKDRYPKMEARDVIKKVKLYLFEKTEKDSPNMKKEDIEKLVVDELLSESAIISYLTDVNKNLMLPIDSSWNTASLEKFPVNDGAVPFLLIVQSLRRETISKLLTKREAKWFSRFYSLIPFLHFPDDYKTSLPPDLTYQLSYLDTWAQIYAKREKINTIAEIKEPDNSILDQLILENKYDDIFSENIVKCSSNDNSEFMEPEKSSEKYPLIIDERIKYFESTYLDYYFGSPDMSDESSYLYLKILQSTYIKTDIPKKIRSLTHLNKRALFIKIRQWVKNNPVYDPEIDLTDLTPILRKILSTFSRSKLV
jgi:hypothetical protein